MVIQVTYPAEIALFTVELVILECEKLKKLHDLSYM